MQTVKCEACGKRDAKIAECSRVECPERRQLSANVPGGAETIFNASGCSVKLWHNWEDGNWTGNAEL